jgi:hypothetical protein
VIPENFETGKKGQYAKIYKKGGKTYKDVPEKLNCYTVS